MGKHSTSTSITYKSLRTCCLALLGFCCVSLSGNMFANPNTSAKPVIGAIAPDFTLKSQQGENIRLFEQRGNYVLLYFWASWSGAATRLLEQYDSLYQENKDKKLVVLSISVDPNNINKVLSRQSINHPALMDNNQDISRLYHLQNIPTVYLLDQGGKIIMTLEGYDPRYFDLVQNRINRELKPDE